MIAVEICHECRRIAATGVHLAVELCPGCFSWRCACLDCKCDHSGARLVAEAEALQIRADSCPDPARASVLRRAAADVSVIAERVRG
jgi:hypothetical protein